MFQQFLTPVWITALSVGSLLGIVIKYFFDLFSKQQDYLNDYKKIIIKKRLDAYEKIETFISSSDEFDKLNIVLITLSTGGKISGEQLEHLHIHEKRIDQMDGDNLFLSKKMNDLITDFTIDFMHLKSAVYNDHIDEAASSQAHRLIWTLDTIRKQHFRDLMGLPNVKKFRAERINLDWYQKLWF